MLNIFLIILYLITSSIAGYLTWLIVYKWKLGTEINPLINKVGLWLKIPFVLAIIGLTIWQQNWKIMVIPNIISLADAINNIICYFRVSERR